MEQAEVERWRVKKPVVFLIFNRPETTACVFEKIREVRPELLLVVADGPRAGHPADKTRCAEARAIIEQTDWDCEVRKNYSDINLGCRERVSSGLSWVFEQVEEAIILEDDCLPHPSFFRFCEELLDRYKHDDRIGHIGGVNFQFGRKRTEYSYYFSRYSHVWGWASWRRAWDGYDADLKVWPEIRDGDWLIDMLGEKGLVAYWRSIFDRVYEKKIDTWDYQWTFHCWIQNRLSVVPSVNLVSNIGFQFEATHTKGRSRYSNMETYAMDLPLRHPPFIIRDALADRFTERNHYTAGLSLANIRQRLELIARSLVNAV